MRKHTHRNTIRLTARERAVVCVNDPCWVTEEGSPVYSELRDLIEAALQAHARQALARERNRNGLWLAAMPRERLRRETRFCPSTGCLREAGHKGECRQAKGRRP